MRWGILATGNIAKNFAKTISSMNDPNESVVAVGSRDSERAESFASEFGIERAYGAYEDLAADTDVEAVYIATPNNLHYENTLLYLQNGKHVLCEKPFTTCAKDAEKLYAFAEEKRLFLMEGVWIRFLPLYDELKKVLRSGELGSIRHMNVQYGFIANGARRERKFLSKLGGGALLDIGIYNLTFLHMLTGQSPESFTSIVHMSEYGTDEYSALQLVYPDGVTAHSLQTIGMQIDRKAAILCSKGAVYLDDFQHAERLLVKPNEGEERIIELPFEYNGFEYEIREVSRCIAEGKTYSYRFTPEESLAVLKTMDEIRESWNMRFVFEN